MQVVLGVNSALAVLAMASKVTDLPTADTKKDDPLLERPDYVAQACKVRAVCRLPAVRQLHKGTDTCMLVIAVQLIEAHPMCTAAE